MISRFKTSISNKLACNADSLVIEWEAEAAAAAEEEEAAADDCTAAANAIACWDACCSRSWICCLNVSLFILSAARKSSTARFSTWNTLNFQLF